MNKVWTPEDIKEFENEYQVNCTLRPDGLYDIDNTIYIEHCEVYSLLDILPPIHTLNGEFYCGYNNLIDLKGCPIRITRYFSCFGNKLINLNGAPKYVGGSMNCEGNSDLRFTRSDIDAMNIQGTSHYDPEQLVPEDPSEFIERELLPI